MKCDEIRELLSVYADGEADADEARTVEEHLSRCPDCVHALEQSRRIHLALSTMERIEPSPAFLHRVMGSLPAQGTAPSRAAKRTWWIPRSLGQVAAVVAASLVLALAGLALAPVSDTPRVIAGAVTGEDVRIEGRNVVVPLGTTIEGGLTVVGGDVTVLGRVKGDVRVLRGNLILASTAQVDGEIIRATGLGAQLREALQFALDHIRERLQGLGR